MPPPPSPLTGPSSRKFCPPPVRSLRTTCSRWSTSNYVSKWENDVKLLTSLNLTIICRPVTSYGSTESVDSPVGHNLHGDLNLNIARSLNHDWNNLLVEQGMTEWHFRTMFSFSRKDTPKRPAYLALQWHWEDECVDFKYPNTCNTIL